MKKTPARKAASVPSSLSTLDKPVLDLDTQFEGIFHPDKFDVSKLNPVETASVDEQSRTYHRSTSVDKDDSPQATSTPSAYPTRPSLASVKSDEGHSHYDFAHNHPIMTKIRSHKGPRKSSDPVDEVRRDHLANRRQSQSIMEKVAESDEDDEEALAKKEEEIKSLPWKLGGREEPIVDHMAMSPEMTPDEMSSVFESTDENSEKKHSAVHFRGDETGEKRRKTSGVHFQKEDGDTGKNSSDDNEGETKGKKTTKFSLGGEEDEEDEAHDKKTTKFSLGGDDDDEEEHDEEGRRKHRKTGHHGHHKKSSKHHHHHHHHIRALDERMRMGSDVALVDMAKRVIVDDEELDEGDIDNIGSRRFEKTGGRHKISGSTQERRGSHGVIHISEGARDAMGGRLDENIMKAVYGYDKKPDHTPHELFVQMDELEGDKWVERARWIKYEEDLEQGCGRWGKPHVASLSFHSLLNLRVCLEHCALMLDLEANDLPSVVYRVVEELSVMGRLEETQKPHILRVLLYRHKHVGGKDKVKQQIHNVKRSLSQRSLTGLLPTERRSSTTNTPEAKRSLDHLRDDQNKGQEKKEGGFHVINMLAQSGVALAETGMAASSSSEELHKVREWRSSLLAKMADDVEGTTVLVGTLREIDKPLCALVRLASAIDMPNTLEVQVPVRFIFILFTPKSMFDMDCHEMGRAFSTLMSNKGFHNVCYKIEEIRELLHALNTFLDDSMVLPPGDWDAKHLMPITENIEKIRQRRKKQHEREGTAEVEKPDGTDGGDDDREKRNPMERTSRYFGGLIDDIKHRYPHYVSDIKDGLDPQCLAAAIFIYFAALSGAVAFGGLMGEKTKDLIGIPETLIVSAVAGVFFALAACQPLIIIGTTGPVLLFDDALFGFSESNSLSYLPWRFWIGMWTFVISLLVAFFQGSTLVRYFTRFTKDIFASLVSLLFIFEAINKLAKIFKKHPIHSLGDYCQHYDAKTNSSDPMDNTTVLESTVGPLVVALMNGTSDNTTANENENVKYDNEPNTALMSAILMFGTFFLAYFLRIFRNSQFFGRNARRALGDFGVPIAIAVMVLVDFSGGDNLHTEKLKVPEGLAVTDPDKRGWIINPAGDATIGFLPIWAMFAAALPALLLYLLLFMETHICELILMEKTKDVKGSGLHLDIVILSFINFVGAFFGGPWICAATVRAVSHTAALTVMSTTHKPGESPKIVAVKDQRLTAFTVSLLLGVSVLFSPILKMVPFAVLFGVFLYMGQSGMNGVQFFDRLWLILKPVKHHPEVSYTKQVKTWRMNLYTFLQALGLAILWVVKSTPAALAFPFFVVAMIPYRMILKFVFNERELAALDGPDAGKEVGGLRAENDEEDEDFFDEAAGLPRVLTMAAALTGMDDHHQHSNNSFNGDNSANSFNDMTQNGCAGKVA